MTSLPSKTTHQVGAETQTIANTHTPKEGSFGTADVNQSSIPMGALVVNGQTANVSL